MLLKSKTNNFFIYEYERNEESITVTLQKSISVCGKEFFHTGIPGVYHQSIVTAQALLKEDLEIVRDRKGRPLATHVNGETATMYKCHPTMVRIRHDEPRCCKEMPIWTGKNYSNSTFLQPVRRRISEVCTPRICNRFDNPTFNIGSEIFPN